MKYEITACHRVPAKTGQPKIICKLLHRKAAGKILSNRKKLKDVTASEILDDCEEVSNIYINESLTKTNHEVFRAVGNSHGLEMDIST